jgi:hypothetical protein
MAGMAGMLTIRLTIGIALDFHIREAKRARLIRRRMQSVKRGGASRVE